jgi:hypothetical protein
MSDTDFIRPSAGAALLIDGKRAAEMQIARVAEEARAVVARGVTPGIAVVLVGEDPASQVYVRSKVEDGGGLRLSFRAARPAGDDRRGRIAAPCRRAQRRSGHPRHPRATAVARGR